MQCARWLRTERMSSLLRSAAQWAISSRSPFLEAIRQMRQEMGRENTVFVHVTLVPWDSRAGELKTKPTQHSVKELLGIGIQADILLCRTDRYLPKEMKSKIAAFCNVEERAVVTAKDVQSIYECPLGLCS